ncbi:MAG: M14 family zinc carboxypeptidase [Longimicrobiales bacterium]
MRATLTTLVGLWAALAFTNALDAQTPAPEDVIGFAPGEDFKLANYEQVYAYFQALGDASPRVQIFEIGESTLGQPMVVAAVSSADNIQRLDRYREISERLAKAQDLTDSEARRLADEGKVIVWIDGGLHATEVAHGQLMPELAHYLATNESDETRNIRENAVVLVMANMNPDGLDIVADWYMSNVGSPYELSPIPELYHPYVGHDNNRDWYMFTQVETQAVARQLYHEWFPQIVYNHHQSSPFPGRIWTPPFENPVNPNLDPLVVTSINQIGESMKKRFDFEGKPGANSGIVFDMWWNGSMRGAPDFHNMLGFLTETALYRYATPGCYEESDIPDTFGERAANLPAKTPTTNYPNPWLGGCWHMRDAMDYMMTASLAVADIAAELKEDYLFNLYWMGKRQIQRGEAAEGGPFSYVIDLAAQHDPTAAVELLQIFRLAGITVVRADAEFTAGGSTYPEGTYVIPPQAFRPFVVDLMEPKRYPDRRLYPDGPPEPPYDMTGYELRFQMGVTVDPVMEPFPMPGREVFDIPPADGGTLGSGTQWLISSAANGAYKAVNQLFNAGAQVQRSRATLERDGDTWPAGSFLITGIDADEVDRVASANGVAAVGAEEMPEGSWVPLSQPRIGLYKSYVAAMPEGWTRWVFDQFEYPWENLTNEQIQSDDLSGFDVIVIPDQAARAIAQGHEAGQMPADFVGGLGTEGADALERYVEEGGWLLAFDEAVDFVIDEFPVPVRNQARGLASQEFFVPGSLIRVDVDNSDPLAYGMPDEAVAMFARSQVLDVTGLLRASPAATVFGRYAAEDYLVSGWTLGGDQHLAGQPAAVRTSLGDGQVILLGFTPHFRGQPRNTYKLLFNPLLESTVVRRPASDQ